MSWAELGKVDPASLGDARQQLHWAAQVIAAAGETYLAPIADSSHTAMSWLGELEVLAGQLHPGARPFRVALRPRDLNLMLLDEANNLIDDHPLDGRSYEGALRWVRKSVAAVTAGAISVDLVHPAFEIPDHPVARGQRFDRSRSEAFEELARWYANAAGVLGDIAAAAPGAGPVLCWPHRFDLATLVALERGADGQPTRSVGLGLSPGDASSDSPYAYATFWPLREDAPQPPLDGEGRWYDGDWYGARLTAEQLIAAGSASAQEDRLRRFLGSALGHARTVLA
jgi:hypothetical protein